MPRTNHFVAVVATYFRAALSPSDPDTDLQSTSRNPLVAEKSATPSHSKIGTSRTGVPADRRGRGWIRPSPLHESGPQSRLSRGVAEWIGYDSSQSHRRQHKWGGPGSNAVRRPAPPSPPVRNCPSSPVRTSPDQRPARRKASRRTPAFSTPTSEVVADPPDAGQRELC